VKSLILPSAVTPASLLVTILAMFIAVPSLADEDVDQIKDAPPDGTVEVSNVAGEVIVDGWEEESIQVRGTLGKGVERLDFLREGDRTIIEVVYEQGRRRSHGSDLRISIPRGSNLEVTAVSAQIEVSAV